MSYDIEAVGLCSVGLWRSNNEDNICFNGETLPTVHNDDEFSLCRTNSANRPVFGVFDGLGGGPAGEYAYQIAADTLTEQLKNIPADESDMYSFIKQTCLEMNQAVCDFSYKKRCSSSGTTAAILFFTDKRVYAVNLGDSRIYRLSGNRMKQLSVDHVHLDPRGRRYLTQVIGTTKWEGGISPSIKELRHCYAARYFICSDGLTDMVSDDEITETIKGKPLEQALQDLKGKTFEKGAQDNLTIIICDVKAAEPNRLVHFWKGLKR